MPPADTPFLRDVGPQDVDTAGELVKDLGAHNKGEALRLQVARAHPEAVTRAQARPEDSFRTRFLSRDEVEEAFADAFDKEVQQIPEDPREAADLDDNAAEVLSFRVKGKGAAPEKLQVVVLYRVKSGRTGRAVLSYAKLKDSAAAYEDAAASGKFNPFVDEEDRVRFRRELSRAEQAAVKAARGTGESVRAPLGAIEGFNQTEATSSEVLDERRRHDAGFDAELLHDENADDVIPQLDSLTADQLAEYEQVESEGKERKSVLDAIEELRADPNADSFDAAALAGSKVDVIAKAVPDLTEAQLDELENAEKAGKGRKTVFDAINAQRDTAANG